MKDKRTNGPLLHHSGSHHSPSRSAFRAARRCAGLQPASGWWLCQDCSARRPFRRLPAFPPHLRPRAKHVIFCLHVGRGLASRHLRSETKLRELHGKPMPVKVERTQFNNNGNIYGSPFDFAPAARAAFPFPTSFPICGKHCADDLAVVRSMTSPVNEHAQGNFFFHTGFPFIGHPSAGAWTSYGLGTENATCRLRRPEKRRGRNAHGGVGQWSSGFLPAQHQASILQVDATDPVPNIRPKERDLTQRRGSTSSTPSTASSLGHARERRGRGRDPQLRDRLPHAVRRARALRSQWRERGDETSLWFRGEKSHDPGLRTAGPPRAAARRTRGAFHRTHLPPPDARRRSGRESLGPARRPRIGTPQHVRTGRPTHRRFCSSI